MYNVPVPTTRPVDGLVGLNSPQSSQGGFSSLSQGLNFGQQDQWAGLRNTNGTNQAGAGGGFNLQGLGTILSGIGALGSVYGAYQQNKLAKETLAFNKQAYATNLADNRQTYNTSLEDRIRARYNTEGRSSGAADEYLSTNKLGA